MYAGVNVTRLRIYRNMRDQTYLRRRYTRHYFENIARTH